MKNTFFKKSCAALAASLLLTGGIAVAPQSFSTAVVAEAAQIKNESTISSSAITLGESVTLTGKVSDSTGVYTYGFYYKKSDASKWSVLRGYGSGNTFQFKPSSVGDYTVSIRAKDNTGKILKKDLSLNVTAALKISASMSAKETTKGKSITLYASATGGSGGYSYGYFYKRKSAKFWSSIKKYGTSTVVSFTPAFVDDYEISIRVKDSNGTIANKDFDLAVGPEYLCTGSISSEKVTNGKSITIYGSAKGAVGKCTYGYFYKRSGDSRYTTIKDYSSTTFTSFKPDSEGEYEICIKAKDEKGRIAKKICSFKVIRELIITGTIAVRGGSDEVDSNGRYTGYLDREIVFLGDAIGGSGKDYNYRFEYKKSGDKKSTIFQNYCPVDYFEFTPNLPGVYDCVMKVRDSDGNIATLEKSFDVQGKSEPFVSAKLSSDSVSIGTIVTINAYGKDGHSPYKYTYEYAYSSTGYVNAVDYKALASNVSEVSYTLKPTKAGYYRIRVKITDSKEHTAMSKEYDLKVNERQLKSDDEYADMIVASLINSNMNDFDKVLAIHNWIIDNTEYDIEGYSSGDISAKSYRASGVFEEGLAVCDGYTKAFELMASKAGLSVNRVAGTAVNNYGNREAHAWNQVKVDGKWYNIDVTWDDPIIDGSSSGNNLSYKYFLLPDSSFKDHTPDASSTRYSCTTAQPTAKLTKYAIDAELAADKKCAYCESTSAMKTAMANFHNKGINSFRIIYKTSKTDTSQIFNDAFSCAPSGCGIRVSLINWKLDGYWELTVTLS